MPMAAVGIAVVLVACTAGSPPASAPTEPAPSSATATSSDASTEPTAPTAPPGVVRVQGCEPRSLLPSDSTTRCGATVVRALFTPLVDLDPVDATPRWGSEAPDAVAADVVSIDARRWEIELKEGWEFHDGTPVTAESFVQAWDFAAYGPNAQANAFLFAPILGFEELHCPRPGCEPTAEHMRGLRVLDELTLEIVLAAPDRFLPRRLGHHAFSPLPAAALEDPVGWGEAPVGNGPFRMEGGWQHGERISLRAHEDHAGTVPSAERIDLVLHDDAEEAWRDLAAGGLDVADALPPARRAAAREEFPRVTREGDDVQALVVPTHRPELQDDRLALALSKAINRPALIERQLYHAARPARGLVPSAVSDETNRCGHRCSFDPDEARDLLARTEFPAGGIELWFDRGATQEAWVRGIARQWRAHLGLDDHQVRVRSLPHTMWVSHLQDQRIGGLHPIGWSMDVASPLEYLRQLHGPGGLFNFDRYAGAEAGARLAEAAGARTEREAMAALRRLERDIMDDMHHIPLWTLTHEAFHTTRVTGLALDVEGLVQLTQLAVVDEDE